MICDSRFSFITTHMELITVPYIKACCTQKKYGEEQK